MEPALENWRNDADRVALRKQENPLMAINRKFTAVRTFELGYSLKRLTEKPVIIPELYYDGVGLEVGGPSKAFCDNGIMPIYQRASRIDQADFSQDNIWTTILDKKISEYKAIKNGKKYTCEGASLPLQDQSYDFLLSCHMIEHTANPIKTLKEFHRVLKAGGKLVILAPDKRYTFDHNREITSVEHMEQDFINDVQEDDATHYNEAIDNTDYVLYALPITEFAERVYQNKKNRMLHHHVFDRDSLCYIIEKAGFKVIDSRYEIPNHIIVIAEATK